MDRLDQLCRRYPHSCPYLRPSLPMTFIKSNNRYYTPGSLPAAGVGGYCNRGLLNRKRRRT